MTEATDRSQSTRSPWASVLPVMPGTTTIKSRIGLFSISIAEGRRMVERQFHDACHLSPYRGMADVRRPYGGRHGEFVAVVVDTYDDPRLPRLERIRIEVAEVARLLAAHGFAEAGHDLTRDADSISLRQRLSQWSPRTHRI